VAQADDGVQVSGAGGGVVKRPAPTEIVTPMTTQKGDRAGGERDQGADGEGDQAAIVAGIRVD